MNKDKDYLKIRKEEMMLNKRLGQDMKFKIAYATIMNEKGGRDNYRIDVISYDPGEDTKILYNEVVDYIDKELCLDINTKEGNVIMMSEEDYNSLIESLYLAGIPGMYESIVEGANTKLEDCEKIEWK